MQRLLLRVTALAWGVFCIGPAQAQDTAALIAKIRTVGLEGKGNVAAAKAWDQLIQSGNEALIPILAGMDDANPIAANYLRGAFETIAAKALQSNNKLPADQLEVFIEDTKHSGIGRRLAYEWLVKVDEKAPQRLLPKMVNDPGAELRRDAVSVLLKKANATLEAGKKDAAKKQFQKALQFARDRDQVNTIAKNLKSLDAPVDLTDHFGFITNWMVIGPFNSKDGVGFETVYPPEKEINLNAKYEGVDGKTVTWKSAKGNSDKLGVVDLNEAIGDFHGVVAYGYTVVNSPKKREVEIRAGSNNAVRMYLNGKEIYAREEYHHGMQMDQHVGRGVLKAGENQILIKVCQNEQTDSWAQQWSFQVRISDALGAKVPVRVVMNDKNDKSGKE